MKRLEVLLNFNPVLAAYQKITNNPVSELYNELYKVTPESVYIIVFPGVMSTMMKIVRFQLESLLSSPLLVIQMIAIMTKISLQKLPYL